MGDISIGVVKEPADARCAATPATVKAMVKKGWTVKVERGAGIGSGIADKDFADAGGHLVASTEALSCDVLVAVTPDRLTDAKTGIWISHLTNDERLIRHLKKHKMDAYSLNLVPRTTYAQTMDALSSQASLAGYKAVINAAARLPKIFPMMMTAAGTIQAANVVVLGAGVAGLSAIATARRLGANVEASDVRPEAKEQVESLGARFIDVPIDKAGETKGGYATKVSKEFLKRQAEEVGTRLKSADVVIATAQVFGGRPPVLIPEAMVKDMKRGAVIIDIAAGNCALTVPGKIIEKHGVIIDGTLNLPATVPVHATEMYGKNILAFLTDLLADGEKREEITKAQVSEQGTILPEGWA